MNNEQQYFSKIRGQSCDFKRVAMPFRLISLAIFYKIFVMKNANIK